MKLKTYLHFYHLKLHLISLLTRPTLLINNVPTLNFENYMFQNLHHNLVSIYNVFLLLKSCKHSSKILISISPFCNNLPPFVSILNYMFKYRLFWFFFTLFFPIINVIEARFYYLFIDAYELYSTLSICLYK
jgi:hypothetical protein